ncbi:MAG: cupin domain-containing protein [Thermoprotei archaeon]|nr:MAG: cupin domain-containing protein [Thermoprotei archaeon]
MSKAGVKAPIKQVLRLKEMVNYQEDAIVSRLLIDRESGTATLFAFDKGQSLSEHVVPFDALLMVLEGRARITIEGESFDVKEGEAIIMPANKPHAVDAVERFKMLLLLFRV